MFGEGAITASPLAMASVAATVENGTFRQPIVVPGAKQLPATPLYAKTGTADVDGQEQPNSWVVAFDPNQDVAVACLVIDAGYGAQYAAPEVEHFLSLLS